MVPLHQISNISEYEGGSITQVMTDGANVEITHNGKKGVPVGFFYWLTDAPDDATAVTVRFVSATSTTITLIATAVCTIEFIPLYP